MATEATTAVSTLVPIEQHQSTSVVVQQGGALSLNGQSAGGQVTVGSTGTGWGVGGANGPQDLQAVVSGEMAPGVGENDQQILKQHELALQRLEELQGGMIGGEKGGT